MADEKPEETPDPAAELAALRQQLAEQRARNEVFEKTLNSLTRDRSEPVRQPDVGASYPAATPPIPPAVRERLKARLTARGFSDADVEAHWDIIGSFFTEMAQPFANAIGQLADGVDYTRTRLTTKDWDEYEKDIEEEFSTRMRSGKPASRKELYEVVKTRRLPQLIEREAAAQAAKIVEEQKARGAQASAAETEGKSSGGMANARPSQVTRSGPLTKEKFEQMSLEEKEKALENMTF